MCASVLLPAVPPLHRAALPPCVVQEYTAIDSDVPQQGAEQTFLHQADGATGDSNQKRAKHARALYAFRPFSFALWHFGKGRARHADKHTNAIPIDVPFFL